MRYLQLACIIFFASAIGCNATEGRGNNGHGGGGDDAGVGGGGGDDGGGGLDDGGIWTNPDGPTVVMDPVTCMEAAANKSYIGCDYWPTVVANAVWSIFDFAVVVSNPGQNPADITVTGPNNTNQKITIMPGQLDKIYLDWVADLKGTDADANGGTTAIANSVFHAGGAYHLVSSVPVLVYQFNALEYQPKGGKPGKDWSQCPGKGDGMTAPACFSYSNDASLLLPSTAMTGNYRVLGEHGVDGVKGLPPLIPDVPGLRAYIAITATQDNTTVKIQLTSNGAIVKDATGSKITDVGASGTATYTVNAGDVLQLVSGDALKSDLSGSLVQADKPVQVIGGMPCFANPQNACDHIEETVMPAETLGAHYVVTVPTGPHGTPVATTVRMVGNVDGTTLTFSPSVSGAPASLNAGQVYEFDASSDFVVSGNHEFIVGMVMKSGSVVDPGATLDAKGDPSLSSAIAVEQYRLKYVFLAPDDYDLNYADVVAPMGATLMLDGAAVSVAPAQVGTTGYGTYRIKLSNANGGTHTLTSDQPCGLQVLGYGSYTSYQYPGGLDLLSIAPPPPPIS
jgi:hypothetical protein